MSVCDLAACIQTYFLDMHIHVHEHEESVQKGLLCHKGSAPHTLGAPTKTTYYQNSYEIWFSRAPSPQFLTNHVNHIFLHMLSWILAGEGGD